MALEIVKATKFQRKLKMGIYGKSGSGKTYTALAIASGLGDRTLVVDTEGGSSGNYSGRFAFDMIHLDGDPMPATIIEAIKMGEDNGYDTVIIDSMSHAWYALLSQLQRESAKVRGNAYAAWKNVTPLQQVLIRKILNCRCHLICTMRSKMEYVEVTNESGKKNYEAVGSQPIQGKDIEYEFDMLIEMGKGNAAIVRKTRYEVFSGVAIEKPGVDFGQSILAELNSGAAPPTIGKARSEKVMGVIGARGGSEDMAREYVTNHGITVSGPADSWPGETIELLREYARSLAARGAE